MDLLFVLAFDILPFKMKVALISDIHANDAALDAVLDDIQDVGVDLTVCLGDVATLGPSPTVVLQRLQDLGCPCILGNHDDFMLNPSLVHSYTKVPVVVDAIAWCHSRLSDREFSFLRTFKPSLEVPLDDGKTFFLFHGSPRSHTEDLLATTPPDDLDRMLDGRAAPVMAAGHTHIQMLRQHRGSLLVNPGSVGLPFKEYVAGRAPVLLSHAEYATVETRRGNVSVTLRRVAVDADAHRKAVAASDNPLRAMLLQQYA